MRRAIAVTLTRQTKSVADDGLEEVATYSDGTAYRALLAPASVRALQRAELNGTVVTHTARLPRGLALDPHDDRFKGSGGEIYRITGVEDSPVALLVDLELQR